MFSTVVEKVNRMMATGVERPRARARGGGELGLGFHAAPVQKRWSTELDLGGGKPFDKFHVSAAVRALPEGWIWAVGAALTWAVHL